jgi:hypothetical protein
MFRNPFRTQRFTASNTLRALLVFGTIAAAFTTKPALPLQQNSTSLTPHTKSAQIDPRRIVSVSLAANGPTGQFGAEGGFPVQDHECKFRVLCASSGSRPSREARGDAFSPIGARPIHSLSLQMPRFRYEDVYSGLSDVDLACPRQDLACLGSVHGKPTVY